MSESREPFEWCSRWRLCCAALLCEEVDASGLLWCILCDASVHCVVEVVLFRLLRAPSYAATRWRSGEDVCLCLRFCPDFLWAAASMGLGWAYKKWHGLPPQTIPTPPHNGINTHPMLHLRRFLSRQLPSSVRDPRTPVSGFNRTAMTSVSSGIRGKQIHTDSMPTDKHNINVSSTEDFTTIRFPKDKTTYSFHNTFLRDSSDSLGSMDPGTGQKLFTTGEIVGVYPLSIDILDSENVFIKWSDGDECKYSKSFLQKHATVDTRREGKYYEEDVIVWDGASDKEHKFPKFVGHDYQKYMTNKVVLSQVVRELNAFGVSVVSNIPTVTDAEHNQDPLVKKIGERIGYIRPTFYGEVFDVKSKPGATNIAYTNKFLPLHQDLCYYESPPGLQLLHCIKNRATGGENVFADGFAAARHVKHLDSEAYQALLTVPINFHYNRDGHHYFHSRHLVVENDTVPDSLIYQGRDHFKEVNYSPPFQAPFDFGITGRESGSSTGTSTAAKDLGDRHLFQDFLRGLKLFEEFIRAPENRVRLKTAEGTCIVFDNRRVLHARDEFDPHSGERWLKGCYLDKDAFQSKLRAVEIGDL